MEVTITVPLAGAEPGAEQREVFVLVSRRKGDSNAKERGLGWLEVALDARSLATGTLVVFDHRGKQTPGERVKLKETATAKGRTVRILRA
jgi:hypothetical protein